MIYKTLGNTGLSVSVVGIGGHTFSSNTEADALSIFRKCIDAGINIVDTSSVYFQSQACVGIGIKDMQRDAISVISKIPSERTFGEFEQDLKILGLDFVDIALLHNWGRSSFQDGMQALTTLKEQGKVRFIGVSSREPENLIKYYGLDCDVIMQFERHSLLRKPAAPLPDHIGVLNASPFEGGKVFTEYTEPIEGYPVAHIALWHCLSEPSIASNLITFQTISDVERTLEYLAPIPEEIRMDVRDAINETTPV